MLNNDELAFVKSHFDFWNALNDMQKNSIEKNIIKSSFSKGHNLYRADSECIGVLLIKSGELRVYILSEDGREVTLYRLTAGDVCVLSAACVLKNITFDVHIDAELDTEVFIINPSTFGKLSNQNIFVENFVYKNAVERFSDVMWAIEQLLFKSLDKRLAIFILDEINKSGSLELTITQEQIAKYIGSAREAVSRMLKGFQSQGILEQSRGSIRIMDKEKLKNII